MKEQFVSYDSKKRAVFKALVPEAGAELVCRRSGLELPIFIVRVDYGLVVYMTWDSVVFKTPLPLWWKLVDEGAIVRHS